MPLAAGTRLGPYEVLGLIGAGGMGEVYRARDSRLDRTVAIKVLPEDVAGDPDRLRRFDREARALAALEHPNILAIHDIGSERGTAYAVMERLEGETLRHSLGRGALPRRKALGQAIEMARGLGAAHEKGIVHRDLKPENVFVTSDGRVKILDFGLARQDRALSSRPSDVATVMRDTMPGVVLGTVGYMSPEQVRGADVDARSDVFAFGCVLYEMLTGRRAFERETATETMAAILREDPPEAAALGRPLPPAVERTLRRCLEKNPAERFQSARDIACALEAVSDDSRPSGVTQARTPRQTWRRIAATSLVAAKAADGRVLLIPVDGGAIRVLPGAHANELPAQWTEDPRRVFLYRPGEIPARVFQVEVASGSRTLWKEIRPPDVSATGISSLYLTRDGRSGVYGYAHSQVDLYLVGGLK